MRRAAMKLQLTVAENALKTFLEEARARKRFRDA